MVLGADARVQPRAVMVIPLHALLADVAVVTTWQRDNLTLIAQLVDLEALQELHHAELWVPLDVARALGPREEPCYDEAGERRHSHCLEPAERVESEEGEADEAEDDLDEGEQEDVEDHEPHGLDLLVEGLLDHQSLLQLLAERLILRTGSLQNFQGICDLLLALVLKTLLAKLDGGATFVIFD